jgi:glutathione synthase/RimK-type ligase-like ATP-grasp enzyme
MRLQPEYTPLPRKVKDSPDKVIVGSRMPEVPPRIALVSARAALALDEDLPLLCAALRASGAEVDTPCWDDAAIDWGRYAAAVLRSTWDYVERIDEFLPWTERCEAQTRLLNPPAVVRWNTDKHYLVDLARAGIAVVPTRFVEPGAAAGAALRSFLDGDAGALTIGTAEPFSEFVVKPSIGAGSRDAARYARTEADRARTHVQRLLDAGRSVMLQPYLGRVDAQGETAVVHVDGEYSHAFRKGPLLRPGDALVEGLFAPEQITPREPQPQERALAQAVCRAIAARETLYARIDLIRGADDAPVVLELELTEPSLYFAQAPGSAGRFARALLQRVCAPL